MIGAYFQPLAEDSSLAWMEAVIGIGYPSSVGSLFDTTNNVPRIPSPAKLPKPTRVDVGIEFAMTHYENLLRRLGDQVRADPPFYFSERELVEIHDRVIGLLGGMPGIRDRGAVASCVAQPQTAVFGVERFPTIFDKAAGYCFFIVRNHPFFDGNKRTGLVAALTILIDHGFKPIFDEDEMYKLVVGVATGDTELEELTAVFRGACDLGQQDTAH